MCERKIFQGIVNVFSDHIWQWWTATSGTNCCEKTAKFKRLLKVRGIHLGSEKDSWVLSSIYFINNLIIAKVYVRTDAFSFDFVFGDAENAQRFSVDTAVFTPFSWRRMHFREHFHIDAASPKTISVLIVSTEVLSRGIEMCAVCICNTTTLRPSPIWLSEEYFSSHCFQIGQVWSPLA